MNFRRNVIRGRLPAEENTNKKPNRIRVVVSGRAATHARGRTMFCVRRADMSGRDKKFGIGRGRMRKAESTTARRTNVNTSHTHGTGVFYIARRVRKVTAVRDSVGETSIFR